MNKFRDSKVPSERLEPNEIDSPTKSLTLCFLRSLLFKSISAFGLRLACLTPKQHVNNHL